MKLRRLSRLALVAMVLVLPSCELLPPDFPFPIPIPTPGPQNPYDCDNPEALAGRYFKGPNAIEDRIIVALRRPSTVLQRVQARLDQFGIQVDALQEVRVALTHVSARVDDDLLKVVALFLADSDVLYVSHEQRFSVAPLGVEAADSWGLDRIDQRALPLDGEFRPSGDGAGVHVAVIDTGVGVALDGVDDNPEFEGRLRAPCHTEHSFRGCADGHGHGTHVAGTVAGARWGVAKKALLHSVRVLGEDGSGTTSQVIGGIDKVAEWATGAGEVWVANMSLGGPADAPLDQAVCRALQAGVVFSLAAGNDYGADPAGSSPARVIQALTISASDRNDRPADFSNRGAMTDLWAPGVDIESERPDGGSATFSGTSMAAPHVAGALAICLAAGEDMTVDGAMTCVLEAATEGELLGDYGAAPNRLLYVGEGE